MQVCQPITLITISYIGAHGHRARRPTKIPHPQGGPQGGGGDSIIKNARMCWGSENVPILKDALGKKKEIPILKGSSAYFIPIIWCNIGLKCIIPKGHLQSIIF